MTLKKFDLAKNLGLKVAGRMRAAGVPDRFAQGAGEALDKRERRARDAALGLVPFACKLPLDLVKQVQDRGAAHEGGVNGWLTEVLAEALQEGDHSPATKAPAKKAPARKAAARKAPAKAAKADDAQP